MVGVCVWVEDEAKEARRLGGKEARTQGRDAACVHACVREYVYESAGMWANRVGIVYLTWVLELRPTSDLRLPETSVSLLCLPPASPHAPPLVPFGDPHVRSSPQGVEDRQHGGLSQNGGGRRARRGGVLRRSGR